MSYHETIATALRTGMKLHAFLSGGGLRVVSIDGAGKHGYGEHPHIEDALSHAAEDLLAGGRPYAEVYGGSKPMYLTGSSTPSGRLDAWIRSGQTFDAHAEDGVIVVVLSGYQDLQYPEELCDRVMKGGETVRWSTRGFDFESSPIRFADGKPSMSTRTVGLPPRSRRANDAFFYPVTKTGSAPNLEDAIQRALDAEPIETVSADTPED